ncbi:MAG: NACHT domain-containing protein [Brasilonema sp.]
MFVQICEKLGLKWQEVVADNLQSEVEQSSEQEFDIDALVQEIREQVKPKIKQRCGTMRVLDMSQPIELTGERGIYTNVNILEKITGRRRQEIAELLQNCDVENFERFGLNRVTEKRVPGLEAVQRYSKLMVLGKPGAGKTTFLKYLAMQCIEGQFQANRVPLFITLKNFAEESKQPNILEYIAQQLSVCGVTDTNLKAEKLLRQGKALILLDGLDEVREEDTKRVLKQILEISDQFHTNQFVITCRIASKEYTFEPFTEVEVADFDEEQIAIFAQNWFRGKYPDNCHAEWSDSGVKHLSLDGNQRFYVPHAGLAKGSAALRTRCANRMTRQRSSFKN